MKLSWTLMKTLRLPQWNFVRSQYNRGGTKETWNYTLRRLAFQWSGYNRYGLYTHDVINYAHPVVREALRRLPEDMVDARNFRIIRAMQLSCLKIYLPRENWITYEEDLEYRYLDPYVREINAEWDEMNEFDGFNYWDRDWPEHEAK